MLYLQLFQTSSYFIQAIICSLKFLISRDLPIFIKPVDMDRVRSGIGLPGVLLLEHNVA